MKKEVGIKVKNLRRARRAKKLSITGLATRAQVPASRVYWAEHGKSILKEFAVRLARVLGVQLASLRS